MIFYLNIYFKILLNEEEQELILKFLIKEKPLLIQSTMKLWINLNKGLDKIHIHLNEVNQRFKEIKEVN